MAKGLAEVLRFGRYEPLFRIGIGGMAEVYAARIRGEAGFQKLVGVKRMLPHLSGDQKFVDMFLDEARLAAAITSPHVVQTLDLGRADDDSLYIVMELVVGMTLTDVLRHQRERGELVDPGIALELIAQAAQGLDDAHEARTPDGTALHLVHRDVSPQNILVGLDGRARVSDFGIAHAVYLRRTHTQVGEKKGKFSYFSPEQSYGQPLDRRSDIFSLGIVAWELVSGERLFKGKQTEATLAVREKPIPAANEVRPELSKEASDAIMRALDRDPDRRYATAAQMAAALRRAALALGDPVTPRAIGQFVQEVGGASLRRMQARIAGGGDDPRSGTAVLPVEAEGTDALVSQDLLDVGTWSTGVEALGGRSAQDADPTVIPGAAGHTLEELPTVQVAAVGAHAPHALSPTQVALAPDTTPALLERAPPARRWWAFAVAALGVVAVAGGAIAAWVAASEDGDPPASAAAVPEPPPYVPSEPGPADAVEPSPEPPEERSAAAAPPAATATEPAEAVEPAREEPRQARRPARRAPRRRAARPRASAEPASMREPEPREQPTPMRAGSPLPGLDAFDRSVQH